MSNAPVFLSTVVVVVGDVGDVDDVPVTVAEAGDVLGSHERDSDVYFAPTLG